MAKISRKEALLNHIISNMVSAEVDYNDGKISYETFAYVVREYNITAIGHLTKDMQDEYLRHSFVKKMLKTVINNR